MKKLYLLVFISLISFGSNANNWNVLFDKAQYQEVKISPDGKHLAVALLSNGEKALAFIELSSMSVIGGFQLSGNDEIGEYFWGNNERVVIKIVHHKPWQKEPLYYGELYAVNLDGSQNEMIFGYRNGQRQTGSRIKKKEAIRGWGEIIDLLPEDPEHILISSTPMSNNGDNKASIHKLNIYTGILKKRIKRSPISYASFVTNSKGELQLAVGINKSNQKEVYLLEENSWQAVKSDNYGGQFVPLTINNAGTHLYTLDNLNQDKLGLFKLNLSSGEYKQVFTDKDVDITDVEQTVDGREIYALRVDKDYPTYYLINNKLTEAQVFKTITQAFPGYSVNITSHTKDGNYYIAHVSADNAPGQFYLYNTAKRTLTYLFQHYPQLKKEQFAITEPFSFTTSDQWPLHGYFTQGKTTDKGELAPLVVLVHGGPHARDLWGYSPQIQFLANNGYSVLQVNFRGSTGFGRQHKEAGYKNWGTLIQQDIYESLQWAIKAGKVSSNKVCIMGGSFGGYSAIQSLINYPDTYQCAIANAGIYDLELMFEEGDVSQLGFGESYLKTTLGTDPEILKAMSPVYQTERIKAPIFLAHGKKDKRAPFEHAERLMDSLDETNKDYQWYLVDDETHGFYDPENQKVYMNKVLQFLNQHIKS